MNQNFGFINPKKLKKSNRVREIIAKRLKEDETLRQPNLLKKAIDNIDNERQSGIPQFTKMNRSPNRAKKAAVSASVTRKRPEGPGKFVKSVQLSRPTSISRMVG